MGLREKNVCSPSSCRDPSQPSAPSPHPPAAGPLLSVARGASSAYRGGRVSEGWPNSPPVPVFSRWPALPTIPWTLTRKAISGPCVQGFNKIGTNVERNSQQGFEKLTVASSLRWR